ncbi:hypothetical protein BJX99DRAFT_270504 [Aspergillus californicus]
MPPISRTCQSCADSKVRCVRNQVAGTCDRYLYNPSLNEIWSSFITCRCHRLGRECLYRQTGRRFKGFEKDRKIAALESKINELTVDRGNSTATGSEFSPDTDNGHDDIVSRGFLDVEMAERYLSDFKTKLTPHFPFVVIAPNVSANELHQTKPFLCLAILASASYENMRLQRALGQEFKKVVASRMIVGGEISFELLQGLLVFLAWSHYHSRPHRYTQFLQLAISLVIDLRLDRPPQTKMWKTALRFGAEYNLQNETLDRPAWGSDEQRAVLGCFYLSSSIAMLVQKRSTILHVPYHEECRKALREANEYPHDKYIDYVIHLQFIAQKIDHFSANHALDLQRSESGSELYITSLKTELEACYRNLPFDIYESPLLAIQYHATGLCLYQLSLNIQPQHQLPSLYSASETWKDEMSVSALISANSILHLYINLPANEEVGFNNTQWVQIGFALLIAYRQTATASKPDQTAAFRGILSKIASRVGSLCTSDVDMNGARDVFFDFQRRVVQIQRWTDRLHEKQQDNNHAQCPESLQDFQEPSDFDMDKFMQTAENLDGPMWNPLGAPDPQGPPDFLFGPSIEQMMGDWL